MIDSVARLYFNWVTQDLQVLAAFALVFFLLRGGSRNERWQRAWERLKRDRTGFIALFVVALYLTIGALEMLQIPKSDGGTHSILDILASGISPEKSYSAPLAHEILASPRHQKLNGRHLLGTDVLG